MFRFRKSSLIRIGILAGVLAITVALASIALAAGEVGIDNPVATPNMAVYHDANGDGTNQDSELMGHFDAYSLTDGLHFHWTPVAGATYYRVSLIQYTPPNVGPGDPKAEIKMAHHAADDPNGTQFLMTSFGVREPFCLNCVTEIVVTPETASVVQDAEGNNQIVYTALPGTMTSKKFVIIALPSSGGAGSGACRAGWEIYCGYYAEDEEDFEECLQSFSMAKATGFCAECGPENDWCTGGD